MAERVYSHLLYGGSDPIPNSTPLYQVDPASGPAIIKGLTVDLLAGQGGAVYLVGPGHPYINLWIGTNATALETVVFLPLWVVMEPGFSLEFVGTAHSLSVSGQQLSP